uniref:AB hydrolase-1 domain-containing protein n=1 Tax=Oryza nivara TaxID=4536 RepID=A0A0E0FUA1_ORYNI
MRGCKISFSYHQFELSAVYDPMGGLYIPRPIVEVAPSTRRRLDYVTIRDTPPVPPMADGKVDCKHLVLVHGACIGGWTYFKVATRLRSAGYRVTAPDLGASGVDPRPLREVPTFRDYTAPLLGLLGSLPPGEKVVLVGHSLGGINVALAAELFPDKIAAAVFLCAFMPDHTSRPSHVLEKFIEGKWLDWMDTEFKPQDAEGKLPTSMLFGPQIAQERLMQLCSPEDVTLAGSLLRMSSMFVEDLQKQQPFTEGRYGSVRKVYVVVNQDLAIPEGFQRWMIGNSPVDEVKEIDAADHLVMLSRPDELARCLADIAESYA